MADHPRGFDPSKTGSSHTGGRMSFGSRRGDSNAVSRNRSGHLDDHRKPKKPLGGISPAARARKAKTDGNDMPLRLGPFTKGQTGIPRLNPPPGRRATRHKQNTNSLAGFLRSRGGIT